jgi:hypothetical protein
MFNVARNNLENEISFLKRNKLKPNIDYILYQARMSALGDSSVAQRPPDESTIDIEYKINTLAFYKLLSAHYDQLFLALLNDRILQIINNYDKYVREYNEQINNNLKQTVFGLNDDISKLIKEYPNIKNSKIFYKDIDDCPCNRSSFKSNDSYESYSNYLNPENSYIVRSNIDIYDSPTKSNISVMLEESPRFSQQINDIHSKLFNIIASPHESLDKLNKNLQNGFSNRDSIPRSIIGDELTHDHVNILRKRFSTYLEYNRVAIIESDNNLRHSSHK